MDEYWNSQVLEFGAVNITGFRILQPASIDFRSFLSVWRSIDPSFVREDGTTKQISVSFSQVTAVFTAVQFSDFTFFNNTLSKSHVSKEQK